MMNRRSPTTFSRLHDVLEQSQLALFEPHAAELELVYPPQEYGPGGLTKARIPEWRHILLRANFLCTAVTKMTTREIGERTYEVAELLAVSQKPGSIEGTMRLILDDPETRGRFKEGTVYTLDFSEAPMKSRSA
jgi:hypothetical protein